MGNYKMGVYSIQTSHFPNFTAISTKLSAGNHHLGQQFLQYGRSCIQPGLHYFLNRFRGDLNSSIAAFKAARLIILQKITEMQLVVSAIDALTSFSFPS